MGVFEAIKAAIPITDAAQRYGLEVGRNGMTLCPFHRERTPSFKLYDDSFFCFGCGAHGDVLDLTAHLLGLSSPLAAARQLNADFGLGLSMDGAPDPLAARRRQAQYRQDTQLIASFELWCHNAARAVLWALDTLEGVLAVPPTDPDAGPSPEFCAALHDYPLYVHLWGCLTYGSPSEKVSVFKNWRREVGLIERNRQAACVKHT